MKFSELHNYYQSLNIDQHIQALKQLGDEIILSTHQQLTLEPNYIYFITEGSISLSITDSQHIIGNTIEHMPIGLMERYCPLVTLTYTCVSNVTAVKLPYEQFEKFFLSDKIEHTKLLPIILSYMTIFTLDLHNEREKCTSYQVIREMLFRYIYRTQVHTHETEGVAAFILQRTNLSRAQVFRILSDLKKGEYITIEKGKLVSINKALPSDY